ncbi:MAG TPA: DUF3905 domain-containing protein [Bacilli bacterium]
MEKEKGQQTTEQEKKAAPDTGNLDPFEINFLPQFEENRGPREAFVNQYGVTIGDHMYESQESPLQQWSVETNPSMMSGDEWVHPFKDIGFQTEENRQYFEKGIAPQAGIFMHPDKDVAYEMNLETVDGEPSDKPSQ